MVFLFRNRRDGVVSLKIETNNTSQHQTAAELEGLRSPRRSCLSVKIKEGCEKRFSVDEALLHRAAGWCVLFEITDNTPQNQTATELEGLRRVCK